MFKTLSNVRITFLENHPIVALSLCVTFLVVMACMAGAYLA